MPVTMIALEDAALRGYPTVDANATMEQMRSICKSSAMDADGDVVTLGYAGGSRRHLHALMLAAQETAGDRCVQIVVEGMPPEQMRRAYPALEKRLSALAAPLIFSIPKLAASPKLVPSADMEPCCDAAPMEIPRELAEQLRQLDEGFSRTLLRLIDARGMSDVECYKAANLDRKLFSKIRSDPAYRPGKRTVMALGLALRLDLDSMKDLLRRAGFALSQASEADVIITYCVEHGIYDVLEVNQMLYAFDQQLLGG